MSGIKKGRRVGLTITADSVGVAGNLENGRDLGDDSQFRCTVCGQIGTVGRCCGLNTREPLNDLARAELAACECVDWCSDGLHRRLELIERLRDNMRKWGNEEDGIPDSAWKAFCDAEAVAGPTKAAKAGKDAK